MAKNDIDPNDGLITPERRAKGDLEVAMNAKGQVTRAIPIGLTIAKELIRRGVFPYHYEIYGLGFLELQNAFRSPWAAKCSAVLLEQWGVGVSNSMANEIYEIVYNKVGRQRIDIIRYVLEEDKEREDRESHAQYKYCFERLIEAMDEEKSRVEEERRLK
jgi:hypothetical protein